jgi:hypothetical protein
MAVRLVLAKNVPAAIHFQVFPSMWTIIPSQAVFADEKLASLSVECPTNMRNDEEFGILVALWCGKIWDRIRVNDVMQQFCFGFLAGEVSVETSAGRIANQGRLEVEACRFKVVQSETNQTKNDAAVGGQFGLEVPKWISFGKAAADLSGHLNRTVSKIEQREGEQYQVFWRVADAGFNFWRVFGVGLNRENVLENKILGDEPLCRVIADGADTIDVSIDFRCDLRDLWFEREMRPDAVRDLRFDKQQDDRNRAAVAARVVAIALKPLKDTDATASWGTVTLARQKFRSARNKTAAVSA